MSKKVKWSEIPAGLKWGAGVGLAACIVALLAPFEIKMIFFVASLFAAVLGFMDQGVKYNFRLAGFEIVADEDDYGPHPFITGLGLGMAPIWVVMIVFALWKWFGWWLVEVVAVLSAIIIFQEKIKELYYFIADRIGEKWYGSNIQRYFLDHQAGVCFFLGIAILIISLGVLCASQPGSLLRMLFCVAGLIFGAIIAFIGVGIKTTESG